MLSDDDEYPHDPMTATLPHWYRSATPMPNTTIGHRKLFPPDRDEVLDLSSGGGRTVRPVDAEGYRVHFYEEWRSGEKVVNENGGSVISPP